MKLTRVHVTNYRCIDDSNPVEIATSTCLVGKNESGKTAFLKALEGLRSVDSSYSEYSRTENYPRRYLADYDERHKGEEARIIRTSWELEEDDKEALSDEFGEDAITGDQVSISKSYGTSGSTWSVPIDEAAVLREMVVRFDLSGDEKAQIEPLIHTKVCAAKLERLEERNESQSQMLEAIKKYRDSTAVLAAIDILNTRTPRFLYFSHYDRMSGEISINQLNQHKAENRIKEGDQVFLDFLEYAGTNLEELTGATQFEVLNARCEAAANRITDQIFEYWTQNDQLSIDVRLDEGKPEDKPPFNSGPVARARVENSLHRVTVPFSERSAGFIWFFSFLVKFAQIRRHQGNVIILLDEPGLTLHGTAQKDLLRYFKEKLEPSHQLIYTTHSPFMVPPDDLASARTVEDVVVEDDRGRRRSKGTKIRSDVLTTDPQTNFPLLGAMGLEVTQTLVIGPNTLLVEGPADILYLQAASKRLQSLGRTHLDPKWAICPSGGIDKVLPFVRLFYGNKLNTVVLTDFERGQKGKLKNLYQSELLEAERIILATEIAQKEEADIEDFFTESFFATLLNATYGLKGEHKLTARKLTGANRKTKRNVKRAEAYFRVLPQRYEDFGHYDPALHLLTHPELLEEDSAAVNKSLDKFEAAFVKIARHV